MDALTFIEATSAIAGLAVVLAYLGCSEGHNFRNVGGVFGLWLAAAAVLAIINKM